MVACGQVLAMSQLFLRKCFNPVSSKELCYKGLNLNHILAFDYKSKLLQPQAFTNILVLTVMVNHASVPK
jgi:hypothetical protein